MNIYVRWYTHCFRTGTYWVSMIVHGWSGGTHVMDDFGNLIPV